MEINVIKLKEYASGYGVLYVEDDELIRTQTVEFLGRFFPKIDIAKDGQEGIELYDPARHDIVISDINMPRKNGIEMIEEIRKMNEEQIVLVTSAYNDSENLMKLINLGIHRFVLKPFNFKQFIIMLYYIVEDIYIRRHNIAIQKESQIIVDIMKNGVVVMKNFHVTTVNGAFLQMGGFASLKTLLLEMPEIGVMFQPCADCLNALSNEEFVSSLKSLDKSKHKVRIEGESRFHEYHVHMSEVDGLSHVILVFTDITAIHENMHLELHTQLPSRRALLEQMEIYGNISSKMFVLMVKIKNYNCMGKWYRKIDVLEVEKEASSMLKYFAKKSLDDNFIGYFGDGNFTIVGLEEFSKITTQEIEESVINALNDINAMKVERGSESIHLSYITNVLSIKAKTKIAEMEVMLTNAFDMML